MLPRHLKTGLLITLFLIFATQAHAGWDPEKHKNMELEAKETVRQFRAQDPSLSKFFNNAVGWAVFPTVGKGGFWVGGAYGSGTVYEYNKVIGYTELKQLTVGLQFGGQAYSEIIFFGDAAALKRFQSGKAEFDAQISAVVADKGAAANVDYHSGVAVFTMTKGGLMAEASVGGQAFTYTAKK